jgi:hypothetical protein
VFNRTGQEVVYFTFLSFFIRVNKMLAKIFIILTLKKEDKSGIPEAEMKFLRKTAKYTLFDHKSNQDIMKEMKIQPVLEKNQQLQTQLDITCPKMGSF